MKRHLPNEKERIELAKGFCELFKNKIPYSIDLIFVIGGVQKAAAIDLKWKWITKQDIEKIITFLKTKEIPYKVIGRDLYFLAPQTKNPEKEFKKIEESLKAKKAGGWRGLEKYHRLRGEFFGIPESAIEIFVRQEYARSTASAEGESVPLPQYRGDPFSTFVYDTKNVSGDLLQQIRKNELFLRKYFPNLYKLRIRVRKGIDRDIYGKSKVLK